MKLKLRQHLLESTFLVMLTLGAFAIAKAQNTNDAEPPQKKVRVEVEVTENGKKSTSVQELTFSKESINGQLDEMVNEIESILEEAMEDLEETDLEIIIKRNNIGEGERRAPHYHRYMSVFPDAPVHWDHEGKKHAFLGVVAERLGDTELEELKQDKAVRITKVVSSSAAEEAGLKEGDIVLSLDNEEVGSFSELSKAIKRNEPGEEVNIVVLRDGKEQSITAKLREQEVREFHYEGHMPHPPHPPHPPKAPKGGTHWNYNYNYSYDFDDEADLDEKAFLGIIGSSEDDGGVEITKVFKGSTAEKMGLKEGDVIQKLDNEEVEDVGELVDHLNVLEPGDNLKVEFKREGKKMKETGSLGSKAEHKERIREHRDEHMHEGDKRVRMRIRVESLNEDEIRELNQKSGKQLDETNSLDIEGVRFSPNPNNGQFKLFFDLPKEGDTQVQIFDFNGKTVYEQNLKGFSGIYSNQVDISDQPSGVYFVSITQGDKGMVSRVVKH